MAEEQGVKLVSNLAPACTVEGDPVRLGQVLYNLLSNAVKFTQAEGTVELHSRKEGSLLRIEVRDTGRGIEPEDCEQVFDKFFQADDAATGKGKQTAGSGLGLAIAKALVESHGGDIGVGSEPGQGTTFWFTLALV
jgi:signal transduction histidine kinase